MRRGSVPFLKGPPFFGVVKLQEPFFCGGLAGNRFFRVVLQKTPLFSVVLQEPFFFFWGGGGFAGNHFFGGLTGNHFFGVFLQEPTFFQEPLFLVVSQEISFLGWLYRKPPVLGGFTGNQI